MRTQKISCIFLIVLSVLLFYSCAEQGPSGPAGADGDGLICVNFQQGVYPDASYAGTTDTRIYSGIPTENYGGCFNFAVGYTDVLRTARALLKFDISGAIPAGAVIKNAYLTLLPYYFEDGEVTCMLYSVTSSWTEGIAGCGGTADVNASWNYRDGSANAWTSPGGDFSTATAGTAAGAGTTEDYVTITVAPSVVQAWLDSPGENYGLLLKSNDETSGNLAAFYSSESGNTASRPRLTVYYTAP